MTRRFWTKRDAADGCSAGVDVRSIVKAKPLQYKRFNFEACWIRDLAGGFLLTLRRTPITSLSDRNSIPAFSNADLIALTVLDRASAVPPSSR
jgi:hypothetical protein